MIEGGALGLALPLTADVPSSADLLEELLAEVVAAERAGFGLCMIPEHRQGPTVSLGAPLTVAAAALARTSTIAVATGVLLAGVHHPVHLAEQVVTLDHLGRGRFALGVGSGYQAADLEPFGVTMRDRAARLEDVLRAVDLLLRGATPSDAGPAAPAPEVRVSPPPFSRPRPPIWVGAWSDAGVARAATLADGWIADPIRTDGEVADMADAYRAACERAGTSGTVTVMREAWVDEDDATAADRFAAVIEPIYRYYRRRGAYLEGPEDGSGVRFRDLEDRLVFGSPRTCLERAAQVRDRTGADRVVLHLRHPSGPGHDHMLAALAALGRELST